MPFAYSDRPHQRRHGPAGYTDYASYKPWLRDDFDFRCVYCLTRERWQHDGHAGFGVDHLLPRSARPDLECVYGNLVYACGRCNSIRQARPVLDPCAVAFGDHHRVLGDGRVQGLTSEGQDLIDALQLNEKRRIDYRRCVFRLVVLARNHPATPGVMEQFRAFFGYPDDLPDLDGLRPPANTRPEGLARACSRLRERGVLADFYAVE